MSFEIIFGRILLFVNPVSRRETVILRIEKPEGKMGQELHFPIQIYRLMKAQVWLRVPKVEQELVRRLTLAVVDDGEGGLSRRLQPSAQHVELMIGIDDHLARLQRHAQRRVSIVGRRRRDRYPEAFKRGDRRELALRVAQAVPRRPKGRGTHF
jgi:hypothetical protein